MEERIGHTLDTLHEALDAAYAVRGRGVAQDDQAGLAQAEARIMALEERIARLEGVVQPWGHGPGHRAAYMPEGGTA
jgi:hypothetical protein